jgi:adrenergic receptor alpha-1B
MTVLNHSTSPCSVVDNVDNCTHGVESSYPHNATSSELPYWSLPCRIGLSLTLGAIMVAAIVGNLLVIVVVAKNRGMRTRTNLFLCNLAVADFLCAVIDMPFSLVTVATGRWMFGDIVCQVRPLVWS